MKTTRLILSLLAAMAVTVPASAQFANTGAAGAQKTKSKSGGLYKDTHNYNRLYLSYAPIKFKVDEKDVEDIKFKGGAVGYLYGLNLTKQQPLFLELGANLAYYAGKQTEDYSEKYYSKTTKYSMFSVNVPVNVAYKLSFGEKLAVTPYIGINFRGNISGKMKFEESYDEDNDYDYYAGGYYEDDYDGDSGNQKVNIFDKNKMKEAGYGDAWKRFQMGWQIGVGFDYSRLHIDFGYGTDFSEIAKKTKGKRTMISVGYNF